MILTLLSNLFASVAQADEICIACAGKAFSAISAAFSTQGYYLQADIIEQIFYNGMGSWAMLAYIASACGGLVGVATGASPKNYMWYFMGPALYHWLVGTTYLTHGVSWEVGGVPRDQREVWKIAKTGLETSNYAVRYGVEVDPVQGPSYPAEVADFFAWYDDVTSDTVQQLVSWLAVPYMRNQFGGENITKADVISDAKWRYLQDIVGARFSNPGLQVAFTYFLEGSCGQVLRKYVDKAAFAQAVNQQGRNLRSDFSFFRSPLTTVAAPYSDIIQALGTKTVSSRQLMKQVFKDGSFMAETMLTPLLTAFESLPGKNYATRIDCNDYLVVLMQAFRWEAARIYTEIVKNLPSAITEDQFVAQLFHGWEIPLTVGPAGARQFMINLILAHLIGNEFLLSPRSFAIPTYNAGERVVKEFVPSSQRMTQPVSKFSELYVWALMVPYFQGLLLFMLAVAYPFACMLVVMPGFHKVMFTWMSMYLWVKLWDFGFAMVQLIDRGVWSTLGNTANAQGVNNVVEALAGLHNVFVQVIPGTPLTPASSVILATPMTSFDTYLQMLDLGMQLSFNVDYSLANSYYIYIMSALYFAVPVVLGQLVLSGKGWIADLAKGAIGTMAGDTKGGVQSGAVDALTRASKQQFDAQRVASKMASTESASFMAKALGGKNEAELAKMDGAYGKMYAERMSQKNQASMAMLGGAEKRLSAAGQELSAANAGLDQFQKKVSGAQYQFAGMKAGLDEAGRRAEATGKLIDIEEKGLGQRKAAQDALVNMLSNTGDLKTFLNDMLKLNNSNKDTRAAQISDSLPSRTVDPSKLNSTPTRSNGSSSNSGQQPGNSNVSAPQDGGDTPAPLTDKAKAFFDPAKGAFVAGVSAMLAANEVGSGRIGPGLGVAAINSNPDSMLGNPATYEFLARAANQKGIEYLAQESRRVSEMAIQNSQYGAGIAMANAHGARVEGAFSELNQQVAGLQEQVAGAQRTNALAQSGLAQTQAFMQDNVAREILGMQVDAANIATQRDYDANRLSNQAGVDETRAAFAADMDVSYATQLGGQSVGGVLSAAGVVAGSFTGTAMNDNLKALAYEEGLEGEAGERAAQAGRFFEQGGVFDTTQRGYQSELATGGEVKQGLGGAAGVAVSSAVSGAGDARREISSVANDVGQKADNISMGKVSSEIGNFGSKVDQLSKTNPAEALSAKPIPYLADAVGIQGADTKSGDGFFGLRGFAGMMGEDVIKAVPGGKAALDGIGGAVDAAKDVVRPDTNMDKIGNNVRSELGVGKK